MSEKIFVSAYSKGTEKSETVGGSGEKFMVCVCVLANAGNLSDASSIFFFVF